MHIETAKDLREAAALLRTLNSGELAERCERAADIEDRDRRATSPMQPRASLPKALEARRTMPAPRRRYINLYRDADGEYAETTPRTRDAAIEEIVDSWACLTYAGTIELTDTPSGLPTSRTIDLSADAQQYGSAA